MSANPTPFRLPIENPRAYDPSLLEAIHGMIAELRHELGNPVNSIKAALTLVRRGIGSYPLEKTLTYLDATLAEVSRIERLLQSLRRLSEPSARTPQVVELDTFLAELLARYAFEVERRGIVLVARPAAAGRAAVDPDALSQVLLDLLNGAVQRLGRVEEPLLEIEAGPRGEIYTIELRSNGRAAEEGKELPFVTSTLGPRNEDHRLALAISRQILLQMGATVATVELSPESWISRIELPLAANPASWG